MQRNRQYEAFRPPLTEEQKNRIRQAENPTKEYGLIAVEEAKKQLSVAVNAGGEHNALPESEDACLRVPAVDPRGQYSILSMKVSRRSRAIESTLPLREKAVGELVGEILSAPAVRERWIRLQKLSPAPPDSHPGGEALLGRERGRLPPRAGPQAGGGPGRG